MFMEENNIDITQIRAEFAKCASSPVYFVENYCFIKSKNYGKMKFKLYPFQKELLKSFHKHRYVSVNKSRQLGVTNLSSVYALWYMLFKNDKNVLGISSTQEKSKNIIEYLKYAYNYLPDWLKLGDDKYNELSLRFTNNSQIKVVSSDIDSARSETSNLLIIDEAAFIAHADELFAAAHQSLSKDGKCFVISTPNGISNWFYNVQTDAMNGRGLFKGLEYNWTNNPDLSPQWRHEQTMALGTKKAAQECDCTFLATGEGVVDYEWIKEVENDVLEPVEKRLTTGDLWVWKKPDPSKAYMICADVARGDGEDSSAFHVLDIETVEQVAEFKGKCDTTDYAKLLNSVGCEYNMAFLVVENNSIGWAVLQVLVSDGYSNLYYSKKGGVPISYNEYYDKEDMTSVPGFNTSTKNRGLVINSLLQYMKDKSITIRSRRTIQELKTLIWKNGKAVASLGANDDLIMSLSIGLYLRDTVLRYKTENMKVSSIIANSADRLYGNGVVNQDNNVPKNNDAYLLLPSTMNTNNKNPYVIKVGNNPKGGALLEDISWLFQK